MTDKQRCQKCGCETKGEEAWVDGQIWCHPCADEVPPGRLSETVKQERMMGHYASEMDGSPGPNHRSCSCNTADSPPEPCAQRHATSECKRVEGLRKLVDIVWLHATEGAHYPSTKTADMLIGRYIERVGAVEAMHKSSDPQ